MTDKLKIAFISSEAVPFSKTGGLADVSAGLSQAIGEEGQEISLFLPFYRETKVQNFGIKIFKDGLSTDLGNKTIDFSLYSCRKGKVDFYFIDKDEYFDREFLYGTPEYDYPDNALRFAFFSKAVLKSLEAIQFKPDIIHCNDWQTALTFFYLKFSLGRESFFKGISTLFTIHNLAYRGIFPKEVLPQIGIGYEFFNPDNLEFYGDISYIKAGILYSDAITTVSKTYAREILSEEFADKLSGLIQSRKDNLYGIINGVDYSCWNPEKDSFIKANYNEKNLKNKTECKKDLVQETGLRISPKQPLLGMISRLVENKGIDIIITAIPQIVKLGCGLIILGKGEKKYAKLLTDLAKRYPEHLAVKIAFDNRFAHKIEAGSDIFLMPSRFEPCGLNQIYSLKYGTIPLVRAVGGLNDTVIDYLSNPRSGYGFKFDRADVGDFMEALKKAISIYKNRKQWQNLIVRAMRVDFSWTKSAREYIQLYKDLRKKR